MLGPGPRSPAGSIVDSAALAPAVSPQMLTSPASPGRAAGVLRIRLQRRHHRRRPGLVRPLRRIRVGDGDGVHGRAVDGRRHGRADQCDADRASLKHWSRQFFDLLQFGAIQQPWADIFTKAFCAVCRPEGSLVGVAPPAPTGLRGACPAYTGTYGNAYHGPLQVVQEAGGLVMVLGPAPSEAPAGALGRRRLHVHAVQRERRPGHDLEGQLRGRPGDARIL